MADQNGEFDEEEPIFIGNEEEEDEDEEEEDDDEDEDEVEEYIGYVRQLEGAFDSDGDNVKRRRTEPGEVCSLAEEGSQGDECSGSQIDGLFCPICMEAWTSDGDHHICCLPCGHIFGMSCINRWLKQRKNQGKCPQCNGKCTLKDVRKLFASRLVSVDEESQKRIRSLENKCVSLQKKGADWSKKEAKWRKTEAELRDEVKQLRKRTTYLEGLLGDIPKGPCRSVNARGDSQGKSTSGQKLYPIFRRQESSRRFVLQEELQLDGAHLFDMDASNQFLLIARSLPGIGAKHMLTKMSLVPPHEREEILLPPSTNFIKDLHFSPSSDGLALFTSLGKKLSLLCTESNNVVLTYDLPVAAWTCSWDISSSHYVYAGLQNGSVSMFDMRQTSGPVKFLKGLTSNPVHTIYSLSHNSIPSGLRAVLSASSAGLCQWNFEGADERPIFVPETDKQGVCISLAYCPSSDDIVASYRPKVEMNNEIAISQLSQTPSPVTGQGTMGSHVQYKRVGTGCFRKLSSTYTCVNQIRLPKCAIIDVEKDKKLFASRDEGACELTLQELPSFSVSQRLKSEACPLRDIKYTHAQNQGLLTCLSGDILQIFTT